MSNAIRVAVEGDVGGLVEALREGEASVESFEERVEGMEDGVSSTADEIQNLGTATGKVSDEFHRANKSMADYMARFDKALEITGDVSKALDFAAEKITDLGDDVANASKETSIFSGDLLQLGKGLLGVASIYAGGRWLIGLAENSIEAAKAAGEGAEQFNMWDKSMNRLKRSVGTRLIENLAGSMSILAEAANASADSMDAAAASTQKLAEAGIVREFGPFGPKFKDAITGVAISYADVADAVDIYNDSISEAAESTDILTDSWMSLIERSNLEGADKMVLILADIDREAAAADAELEALEETVRANEEAAKAAEQAYNDFFNAITQGITGETLSLIEGLKFEDLGGDEIINMLESIKRAFEEGAITREEAIAFFGLQFVEEEAFKVIQGIQSEWEASLSIAAALDIDPAVAQQMVRDFIAGIDLISQEDLFAAMGLDEEGLEIPVEFQDPGELKPEVDTTTIDAAETDAQELLKVLNEIDGSTFKAVVDIELKISGEGASGATGGQDAAGGGAFAGVPVVVGDAGLPELFTPGSSGSIAPIGAGSNINNKFNQVFAAPINITIQGGDESSLGAILTEPL